MAAAGAALTLSVASGVNAQSTGPVSLDPAVARQGTALVLGVDAPPSTGAIAVRLPKGTRVSRSSRTKLCSDSNAARATCPPESKVGFGRYVVDVAGYLNPGGDTQLTWAIDAFLGQPAQRGDIASVVLSAKLLGADSVATLLTPEIGTSVPTTATMKARMRKGPELRLPGVPVQFSVAPPATATPLRFELNLSAVRHTRENFIRKIKVPTLSGGYEIRKVKDHRLVGHYLFRAPERCSGTWSYELRLGTKSSAGRIPCQSGF
jgi:hypothetical protein